MLAIILLSLGGVFIATVVGTLWYFPGAPMGKLHMRYLGFDKLTEEEQKKKMDEVKPDMWKTYALQMILSLLTSLATVFIITMSVQNGVQFSMALGFVLMNWLCFMVPVVGGSILWGNIEAELAWPKFFSDAGSHLVIITLIAVMTSFFI